MLSWVSEVVARHRRWDDLKENKLKVVLDELVTNVISHGAVEPPGFVEVDIDIDSTDLAETCLSVRDNSYPFDPLRYSPQRAADVYEDPGPIPVGGWGIGLVKDIASHISYTRDDGWNRLVLYILDEDDAERESGCSFTAQGGA